MFQREKNIKSLFLLIIIILLSNFLCFSEKEVKEDLRNKIINSIIFKGLRKSKPREILNVLVSEQNKPFDLNLVNQDYQNLYSLGFFDEIIISTEKAFDEKTGEELEGKINLIFDFIEKRTIRKIIFKGNKGVVFATLLNAITIKRGSFFDLAIINTDINAILDKYHEKGYNYVKVTYETFEDESLKTRNQTDLIFNIDEGIESYVSEIILNGNNNVSDFTLQNKMKTKERKFLGLQKGVFTENVFYQDIEEIKKYYRDLGYYYVDIMAPEIIRYETEEKGSKKELIRIVINIKENDQYTFGAIDITGNSIISTDDLLFSIKLRPGQVFSYSKYQELLSSMQMSYTSKGYIQTIINDTIQTDFTNRVITVKIEIKESKRSYIEAIYFKGNEKTKDYVLRRAVVTEVGEIFNSNKLMGSIISLYNMGFFTTVDYDIQAGSAPGLLVITYIVEEQKTAEFKFGISIPVNFEGNAQAIYQNISIFGELSEKNLLGREIQVKARTEASIYKQGLDLSIDDPWFFNYPWNLGASFKFYHNWTRLVLRKIDKDEIKEHDYKDEDDAREEYDAKASSDSTNKNYVGYNNDFGNMGIHNLSFESSIRSGYRFLKYFSIFGGLSTEPNYTWLPAANGRTQDLNSDLLRTILEESKIGGQDGWAVRNKIYSTFSISTTQRLVNPFEGIRYSFSLGYIFGHYDAFTMGTKFTAYLKIFDIMFGDWAFQNVLVFNAGASLIFPGFRNVSNSFIFRKNTYGGGPILHSADYLSVDGLFNGRGWANAMGSYSTTATMQNKVGYVKLDYSLEYRMPIYDRVVWLAAFVDMTNLFEGPYQYSRAGIRDSSLSWQWWGTGNNAYSTYMPLGIDNWYGSIGVGVEFTLPQLPLSFFVVKRFKINYFSGIEWLQDDGYGKTGYLDFVLSLVGYSF